MINDTTLKKTLKIFVGILMLTNFFELWAQPLSGILPKYGSYVDQTTVDFEWNTKSGTVDYTVVLAQDPTFSIGMMQSPALTTTTWQSFSLSTGIWYWKVISNDGLQLSESGVNFFRIFKPTDLSNNTLWLAGDGNMQLSGANVSQWTDMSGLGNNFSQSTPTDQPVVTNLPLLNNKQVVHFDGGSDYLNAGNVLNVGTNSITTFVLSFGSGSIYSKFGSGSSPFNIHSCYNLTTEQGIELAGSNYQNFFTSNATNYHILSFRANRTANNAQMRRNMNTVSSGVISGILPLATYNFTNTNPFLIGRYAMSGSPFYLNGDIAEVIFYDRSLTDTERTAVESYLNDKYAPGINLGRDTTLANFCPYTINAPSGYSNLLWSTGETTASISVASPGQFWVRGTNIFGVQSYDTLMVYHPTIPAPNNNAICVGSSNTWNADMGPGFTYLWSTGETTPSISITTPGAYSVQVTGPGACSQNSGNYTFTLDTYSQTAYLGNDTTLCSGNLINLQIGAPETVDYLWPDGSMGIQYVVDTTGNYFVETINTNGCVARDTMLVTITGVAPTADFSVSNVCLGNTAVFTDNSFTPDSSPVDEWLWTFDDGNQSTIQNPTHSYSTPGIYSVQLYVAQGGCGSYFTAPVQVYSLPEASFSWVGTCSADGTDFLDESTIGSANISSWLWNFGQPSSGLANTSVQQYPTKDYGQSGIFNVTLQVTDLNSCVDDTSMSITIYESPISMFTADPACQNSNINIANVSSITAPDFIQAQLWDFGDNTFSILPVPNKSFPDYGYHTIGLTVTANNGCSAFSQVQVLVHSDPIPNFSHSVSCTGTYTEFQDISVVPTGNVASSTWNFDLTDDLAGTDVSYIFTSPGPHNVILESTSNFGCIGDTMIVVSTGPELGANFSASPSTIITGNPVTFTFTGIGADNYNWDLGNNLTSIDAGVTTLYGDEFVDSTIQVELIVGNNLGCSDTAIGTFTIYGARFDLELSNIFLDDQGSFYIVGVQLKNAGTAMIETADLEIELSNGVVIMDTYPDTLQSGESDIYIIETQVSSFISDQDAVDAYICAKGYPNSSIGLVDEDWNNNSFCKDIEGENTILIGPNPNPSSDLVTIGLIVSADTELDLSITDSRGRLVWSVVQGSLSKGMYNYSVPVNQLSNGVYFVHLKSGDQSILKKLMVE